ncbi:hypothetical protein C2767_11115 [Klebsiella quasipneumoniae]|nr:hypothetical protein DP204_11295 [Klebsiella quasipneumoniae subsp. quasipneumoniae]QEY78151.1 hypothetical protein C2767_11115 [Klebsiella quasipneumoniae]
MRLDAFFSRFLLTLSHSAGQRLFTAHGRLVTPSPDAKPEEVIDELRNQQVALAGGLSNPGGANGNGE